MKFKEIIIVLSLILLVNFLLYGQNNSKIIGKWEGQSGKGEVIKIEFHKDGTTELYKGFGGLYNGKVTPAIFWPNYTVDFSKSPYRLDLIYSSNGGKHFSKTKCIFKFISDSEIEIGLPEKDDYPENFDALNVREIWKLRKSTKSKSKK